MGYTHYWTQLRDFSAPEWAKVSEDMQALCESVRAQGIELGDWEGNPKALDFGADRLAFNGIGDDAHESFIISRKAGPWEFCKTAQKPYDLAVTAALCYFATVTKTHNVTSDGDASDWQPGLEEARRVWPNYANVLGLPEEVT